MKNFFPHTLLWKKMSGLLQKKVRAYDFFKVELKIVPLSGPTCSTFQNRLCKKVLKAKVVFDFEKVDISTFSYILSFIMLIVWCFDPCCYRFCHLCNRQTGHLATWSIAPRISLWYFQLLSDPLLLLSIAPSLAHWSTCYQYIRMFSLPNAWNTKSSASVSYLMAALNLLAKCCQTCSCVRLFLSLE